MSGSLSKGPDILVTNLLLNAGIDATGLKARFLHIADSDQPAHEDMLWGFQRSKERAFVELP
ncbi:hypothetical protein JQX09_24670 [Sulfitobacter pseudonitzschiae]|uniref:Uncharacterized protein n=1 Tax=Pseudosulfitobacter pseudonitzschiae TaxID=1402135 RepID=A0A9Q2RWY0_9RHOB|nr:hypothetical protein [Pseudosulfitobacter pseudonitzschiae]MBM2295107.1 hypothetical protein [Pseudosulfitobacter pseudonitzschiae]MBM2299328.1 hypothetical protein [Pseudosulfitobacter pseudonitzschiae]MBM2304941.1 hypothetical protein [Pseudosulfitobacter pseudonitzschiae]MBM2314718.1 hypothetical protein [Pseudosulfitobacter pseudonitzschiae]MBM2319626.1 hypothetical protein [Pseudosulfitobacter pseudonitzschiae]